MSTFTTKRKKSIRLQWLWLSMGVSFVSIWGYGFFFPQVGNTVKSARDIQNPNNRNPLLAAKIDKTKSAESKILVASPTTPPKTSSFSIPNPVELKPLAFENTPLPFQQAQVQQSTHHTTASQNPTLPIFRRRARNTQAQFTQDVTANFNRRYFPASGIPTSTAHAHYTTQNEETLSLSHTPEPLPIGSRFSPKIHLQQRSVISPIQRDLKSAPELRIASILAGRPNRMTKKPNGRNRPQDEEDFKVSLYPDGLPDSLLSRPSKVPSGSQIGQTFPGTGTTNFQLAGIPITGDHHDSQPPKTSGLGYLVPGNSADFGPAPDNSSPYDAEAQKQIYMGKTLNANQRPLLELFRPWYQLGQIPKSQTWLGRHNPVNPRFLLYGDIRTAAAANTQKGNNQSVFATRLNLDFDLRVTSTERIHWFMSPLDRGGQFTRFVRDNDDLKFTSEFDPDIDFGYLEGDLGAIFGGFSGQSMPFDLPFAVGVMPLLFQNGVWLEDAFLGAAFTIPARNSPWLDISNYDITFFTAFDKVNSAAFGKDDNAAKMYGFASFIEAAGGYFEVDYAYLEDRRALKRTYHNTSFAYTRRYGRFVSNSIRIINNAGQNPNGIQQTADGTLLLFENSIISSNPLTFVPYYNGFIGFDTPQSAARGDGVLRNTGILFETDGLTGFPTLDANAKNTFGGAIGLNILAKDFSQQLILEAATVQRLKGKNSSAPGEQFGLGFRYQIPLSNAIILRADGMIGITDKRVDRQGFRVELRHKW